jgi:F-type H+-transporting ATPase subunit b
MTQLFSSALLSGASIIDLDGTFFVQMVLFFVAFFVLRALVFNPLLAVFEAREVAIDGAKEEAARLTAKAATAGQTFDDELKKVRTTAAVERDKLRLEAQKREREIQDAAKIETDKSLAAAEAKLASESTALRQELATSVPALGRQIASKLLQREVA